MASNDIGKIYAASLVEIGQEKNILAQLEEDMKFVSDLVSQDKDLNQFLNSPSFSKYTKKEFIKKIFEGKLSDYIVNFLNVLVENNRQSVINDIYNSMKELIDQINNVQKVTIITCNNLESSLLEKIISALKNKFKKDIIVNQVINKNILGGIIIRIGDLVIDGSLFKDLKNIRNNLLNSKVRSEMAYED